MPSSRKSLIAEKLLKLRGKFNELLENLSNTQKLEVGAGEKQAGECEKIT